MPTSEAGPGAAGLPPQVSPPEFALSALGADAMADVSALAYPVLPGDDGLLVDPEADALAESSGLDLLDALDQAGATGAVGELTVLPLVVGGRPCPAYFVGVGEQRPVDLRRAGATLARAAKDRSSLATSLVSSAPDGCLEAFVVGMMLGSFEFHWRSNGPRRQPVARVVLAGHADADDRAPELTRAIAVGGAGWTARALATVPSNLKSPDWLAEQAVALADRQGLTASVWDEVELERRGMGGLSAVGRASASPPRLVRLDYAPASAGRRTPTVVLVGKGITFDSGGLSIKPGEAMATMKRDMTGAAVVIAVLGALARVRCPVRVIGLLAAAENAVGADAMRPGDVVSHYGGRTSEVTNTDAEGRLVLADAMAYAVAELKPAALVDVATLTGAMKVALGQRVGGLFANDDALAEALVAAGESAGEPLWRFPLVKDYEEKLTSKIADADNAAGGAGAITAALFLQHFAGKVPWAHLDLASVGDSPDERFEWTEGPSGFGARVLLEWLSSDNPLAGVR